MNPKLLKTTLAVTLSVIYGVLPATAENPYQDGTLSNPTVSTGTGSTGSTINTATNSGQQTAISNTVGATAQDGQGTMAGTSSIPSTSNQTDLETSAEGCEAIKAQETGMQEAMKIAMITPNIDEIFNAADKASEGCFASSREVINLAISIPQINGSLSSVVKTLIQKEIDKQKQKILQRACEISDKALLSTIQPIQKYVDDINARSAEYSDMMGDLNVPVTTKTYDGVSLIFNNQVKTLQNSIDQKSTQVANAMNAIDLQFNTPSVTPSAGTNSFQPAPATTNTSNSAVSNNVMLGQSVASMGNTNSTSGSTSASPTVSPTAPTVAQSTPSTSTGSYNPYN
jgi:hypothetical protein